MSWTEVPGRSRVHEVARLALAFVAVLVLLQAPAAGFAPLSAPHTAGPGAHSTPLLTEPDTDRPSDRTAPIVLAQSACIKGCQGRIQRCKPPCRRKRLGTDKKSCFRTCKTAFQQCKQRCIVQAKRKKQQKKAKDVKVLLGGKKEPTVSLKEATRLATSDRSEAITAVPPNINDITAILDEQKVADPKLAEERREAARRDLPGGLSLVKQIEFYRTRALAAGKIGDTARQLDDYRKAVELSKRVSADQWRQNLWDLSLAEGAAGDFKAAVLHKEQALKLTRRSGQKMVYSAVLVTSYVRMGALRKAKQKLQSANALLARALTWKSAAKWKEHWLRLVAHANATFLEARGELAEAENHFRESIRLSEAAISSGKSPLDLEYVRYLLTATQLELSKNLERQGRVVEAEVVVRKTLLERLKLEGRYATWIPRILIRFAEVLTAQGRYDEARKMTDTAIEAMVKLGFAPTSIRLIRAEQSLARLALLSGDVETAVAQYDDMKQQLAEQPGLLKRILARDIDLWLASALGARHEEIINSAEALGTAKAAPKNFADAVRRGALAIALSAAGRAGAAHEAFNVVVPYLLGDTKDAVDEEYTVETARAARTNLILDAYIDFLSKLHGTQTASDLKVDAAGTAFQIADAARGQSVQRAVAAASARIAAKDAKLAELVRVEQDTAKRLSAQSGLLATILSAPSDQQDAAAVEELRAEIGKLKAALKTLTAEINRAYPSYAALLNPQPPTPDAVRTVLRDGEAFVSVYAAPDRTYVWAVPKTGDVSFTVVDLGSGRLGKYVSALREALNPTAETLGDVPDFDVRVAHKLYRQLLEPVEAGWKDARSLLFATNGALGQLPLSVLPTKRGRVEADEAPLFAGYRNIAWLARSHAVTSVPSAATLLTLRALPAGDPARAPFLGFGNPVFGPADTEAPSDEETARPATQVAMRGVALKTRGLPIRLRAAPKGPALENRGLASLPQLPDTETEVVSLARAMGADVETAVKLRTEANEQAVRTLNLTRYKVLAFATHGLIPGDLTGLREPALALAAPAGVETDGDGILTMSEIMTLRLDADWVVLSACNTGTARGDGAEAVSGLGRAFFYAGTRALLVSSWPVETTSARMLTTDLFERQTRDPAISRAQALRQAMSALIDRAGLVDEETGDPLFYYAHPIFWAPFVLVGDGGG